MSPAQRYATAVHEGGHAVVASRFGLTVHRVALFDGGGYCETSPRSAPPAARIPMMFGGPVASHRLDGGCGDLDLSRHPRDLNAITSALTEHHGRPTFDWRRSPLGMRAYADARRILTRDWSTVEAIARELLSRGSLDRRDLYDITFNMPAPCAA